MDLLDEEAVILYLIYRRLKKRRIQKGRLQTHKIHHLIEETTPVSENFRIFKQETTDVSENQTTLSQEDACVSKSQTVFCQEATNVPKILTNTSEETVFLPKCQVKSIQKVTKGSKRQTNKIMRKKERRPTNSYASYSRNTTGFFSDFYQELRSNDDKFFEYARISVASFDELLGYLKEDIKKQDTLMRDCIKSEERLLLTLRFLATGCCFGDLKSSFGVGRSTVGKILREVTPCIWSVLAEKEIPPLNRDLFLEISQGFQESTNFPHCIGVIGGKHVRTMQTDNRNNFPSVTLLAMCDSTYKFTFIEVAKLKEPFDSQIFKNSVLQDKLLKGSLDIPPASQLGGGELLPYVILGDKGFAISENLLRPYGKEQLEDRKIFNDHLSKTRQCIETAFGIMIDTWEVLRQPLNIYLDAAENIVKAVCVLHNFVLRRDGKRYANCSELRQKSAMFDIDNDLRSKPNRKTLIIRDKFAKFFMNNTLEKSNK